MPEKIFIWYLTDLMVSIRVNILKHFIDFKDFQRVMNLRNNFFFLCF